MAYSDKAAIDEITAGFFDAFTNGAGAMPDVECLHDIFIPEAIIIKNIGGTPVLYDLAGFIEPRRAILTDGSLVDFCEKEVFEQTEIYGNIAQRFSKYEKTWTASGKKEVGRGAKVIQYIRTSKGWKISSLAWADEQS